MRKGQKRTCTILHFAIILPPNVKKQLTMLQLSPKLLIFASSFVNNIRRHQGERLSFDPSENLENSKYKGEKSESHIYLQV